MRSKFILVVGACIGMTACASAPVQEMSDARQAIRSAEEAGAATHSPQQLHEARRLLEQAQMKLQAGAYGEARHYALDAWDQAVQARERASAAPNP